MKRLLLGRAPRKAVPVVLVRSEDYKSWLKKQPPRLAAWLGTIGYKAKPGSFCVVPDAKGKPSQVIAGLSSPLSVWDVAGMSRCLPKGDYRFGGKVPKADQETLALGWLLGTYRFARYKKAEEKYARLAVDSKIDISRVERMADAIALARDLINTPSSDMGPAELASAIANTGKKFGAKTRQVVGDALIKNNLAAIHIVGRASGRPPRLIDLTWGDPRHPKVTLVGKGVCFDTGGLDIKSSGSMLLMKKDMAGAACALAVAALIMGNKVPVRLRLIVPAVENAIGGDAFRPSDVITMRRGLTVEVGNTDAEGRLILADALTLAGEEKPDLIVDFATLTGAARSAVGTKMSALFANNDDLAERLLTAGKETEDPLWRLPLFGGYESMLDSAVADLTSSPNSPYAGAITAALFLQRFVDKKQPWAHLDFMGWNTSGAAGRPEGGEAMGVRAVYRLIENLAQSL